MRSAATTAPAARPAAAEALAARAVFALQSREGVLAIVIEFLIGHVVVALMLSIGLAARPRDLAHIVRHPRLYARALLVMELGVPLLAMAVVSGLGLAPAATGLILLMAICPGAPLIPAATRAQGARYSVVGLDLLVLASVLAPLTIPLWVALVDRLYVLDLAITPAAVVARVVPTVLAPLFVGLALGVLAPRVAEVLARVVHYVFLAALAVVLVVALYLGAPVLLQASPLVLVAVAIVVVGAAAMGYWAAAPQPDERHAIAVAAVLGNPGLALAIVAASYPGFRAAAFVAAYVIVRKLALLPIERWIKRRRTPTPQPPAVGELQPVGA